MNPNEIRIGLASLSDIIGENPYSGSCPPRRSSFTVGLLKVSRPPIAMADLAAVLPGSFVHSDDVPEGRGTPSPGSWKTSTSISTRIGTMNLIQVGTALRRRPRSATDGRWTRSHFGIADADGGGAPSLP